MKKIEEIMIKQKISGKVIPNKEQIKETTDYGYELGERWRNNIIGFIKRIFGGRKNG